MSDKRTAMSDNRTTMSSKRNEEYGLSEQDLAGRRIRRVDPTNKPLPRTLEESLDTFSQNRGFLHPERNLNADTFGREKDDYRKRNKIEEPYASYRYYSGLF
jgi:hypothetical protein